MTRGALALGLLGASLSGAACEREVPVASATLKVRISDEAGNPLGGRLLLFTDAGEPLHIGKIDLYGKRQATTACELAPGAIGTWDGILLADGSADIPVGADRCLPSPAIAKQRYNVWVWRGIEFDRWEGELDLRHASGDIALPVTLHRAFTPHGTLAADLHVHAQASNDSTVPNPTRVVAQAAAGVQVVALSDHNSNGDLSTEIRALGLTDRIVSIASNELSSETAHLGVYPVVVGPGDRGGAPPTSRLAKLTPDQLLAVANEFPDHPVVQVNHPRFRVTAMFDHLGWNGKTWPPPFGRNFSAIEVLNGHTAFNFGQDRRIDEAVTDFYTFIDHGFLVAPLGNSDTHHLNGVHDALCRTYVFVDDTRLQPFDQAGFITAIHKRRVVATTGPWLDVEVKPSQAAQASAGPGQTVTVDSAAAPGAGSADVWVDITVAQPNFSKADTLRIMVGTPTGATLAKSLVLPLDGKPFRWQGPVAIGDADTWLGVDIAGETPLPIEQTGTYQLEKKRAGVTPFAIISPILIDANHDGRWQRGESDFPILP